MTIICLRPSFNSFPAQFPSLKNDTTSANERIHLSYGLGWGLYSTPDGTAFFKEGHDDGWVHYSVGIPSAGRALVIMCNSSNGEKIFNRLCEKLLGVTIPWHGRVIVLDYGAGP